MSLRHTFGWLLAILDRKNPDGTFHYPTEDLYDFLPVMLLSFGLDERELTPRLQVLIGSFATRAGVRPGMTKASAEAAIQTYLAANPLNPELVFEFERGSREELTTRGHDAIASAFDKYLAQHKSQPASEASSSTSVAGGPMARFLLNRS